MPPADPETSRWFEQEVRPHEPELRAYLRAYFPQHLDFDDLVPETDARLLQARAQQAELRSPKAHLFATGCNFNQAVDEGTAYGPRTPSHRIITSHVEYGSTRYVGVKRTF